MDALIIQFRNSNASHVAQARRTIAKIGPERTSAASSGDMAAGQVVCAHGAAKKTRRGW